MLDRACATLLKETLGAALIVPGTPDYEAARAVWNATADRRPAAIARCKGTEDVAAAVRAAGRAGLSVSVRGGGHHIAGLAVADGGLMLDLSAMRGVAVDPEARIARVQGGATMADLDAATQAHGLAVPGGVVSTTGVGGLTLGGGFGWLARQHGLAIDNLVSVQAVLADGRIVEAGADAHPDLFWALRGGGGNCGIVTEFRFRLHPLAGPVLFGPTFFALDDAGAVLAAYADWVRDAPRAACVWANLMTAPPAPVLPEAVHGTKVLTLMQFHAEGEAGRAAFAPLHDAAPPLGDGLMARPYVEAQGFLDPAYEFGARNYWRAHNHAALTGPLIHEVVSLARDLPTPESEILFSHLGGAIADVPAGDTAYPHRGVPLMCTPGVRWHDAAEDAAMIGWLTAASDRIAGHAVPGAYVNFIAEREGRAADAYGANLARLAEVKHRHDPENRFRANQNVVPRG